MKKRAIAFGVACALVMMSVNVSFADELCAIETGITETEEAIEKDLAEEQEAGEIIEAIEPQMDEAQSGSSMEECVDVLEPESTMDDSMVVPESESTTEDITDVPETETIMETNMDISEPEADLQEESQILLDDGMVLTVEEVDTMDYTQGADAVPELMETVTGQLQESGYASCAVLPEIQPYSVGVYLDSYGGQLSGRAKDIYNAMKASYVDSRVPVSDGAALPIVLSSPVSIYNDNDLLEAHETITYALQAAYEAFAYDFPEVFWMSAPGFAYSYTSTRYPSSVTKVTLNMNMIYSGAGRDVAAFDNGVAAVKAEIDSANNLSNKQQIVRAIHDYLCNNFTYGEGFSQRDQVLAHCAGSVFLPGTGETVCEGYAKAFKLLCKRYGIESALIVGDANGPHMWNYVKMDDNNWYLVDVTWDDSNDPAVPYTVYFLVGSNSVGFRSSKIGEERVICTKFAQSIYSHSFAVPVLSGSEYNGRLGTYHTHTWRTVQKEPTCMENGSVISTCTGCGEQTKQLTEKTNHSFEKKNYRYNNDATCLHNGTQSLMCDYGCGTIAYTVTAYGSKLSPTISLNTTSIVLKKGQSTTAVKVSKLAKGDRITGWRSANTRIAKVNNRTGKITAQKKTGKTKITVTLASGLSKSITVKVQSSTVRTTKISGVSKKLTIQRGKKAKLAPALTPITSQEKVTYSSSNKKIATVNAKGVITAKASGKVKITVKSGSKKVTVTVTVPKITAKKITGIAQAVTLKRGKSKTLKPKLSPAGSADKIRYSSSNKAVASVSAKGKVTARKKGTAVITVKAGKAVAKCKITVK